MDVAAEIGLTIPGRSARQTNWVDYDNDGDLDVYSSDRAGDNKLFQNTGGKFTQVFAGAGPPIRGPPWAPAGSTWTTTATWTFSSPIRRVRPMPCGATIASVRRCTPSLRRGGPHATKEEGGVGCAVGDYDNDGRLDIFVPNYGHNQLYRNNGNGTFTDVAAKVGVGVENHAVGSDWGDYDNDGDLDLRSSRTWEPRARRSR